MREMMSRVGQAWRWFEQAVAASRRREARRLLGEAQRRRRDLVRRAAGRIGTY